MAVLSTAMREWLETAVRPDVVRRGLTYAIVVGAVLIAINHGDAIMRGEIDSRRLVKMGLTVVVPYLVSTFSSVGALLAASSEPRDEQT